MWSKKHQQKITWCEINNVLFWVEGLLPRHRARYCQWSCFLFLRNTPFQWVTNWEEGLKMRVTEWHIEPFIKSSNHMIPAIQKPALHLDWKFPESIYLFLLELSELSFWYLLTKDNSKVSSSFLNVFATLSRS